MPLGPQTVGARLREAREKRGLSLRQLATRTRISVNSLEALEKSDISRLPGGIFTRSFIRTYALEVGLDPDRTIQEFIEELPPAAATATAHQRVIEDSEKLDSDRKAVLTLMRIAAISVPLIGLLIYFGNRRTALAPPVEPAPDVESASGIEEKLQVQPATAPIAATPAATPAASVPAAPLTIEIAPRAPCWISVTADDRSLFSGLMRAGDRRVITAKEYITVSVGDAGAFEYTLNGRRGRRLGAAGQVVTRRITLANLSQFSIP